MRPVGRIPETTRRGTFWGAGRPACAAASVIARCPRRLTPRMKSREPYPKCPAGSLGDVASAAQDVEGSALAGLAGGRLFAVGAEDLLGDLQPLGKLSGRRHRARDGQGRLVRGVPGSFVRPDGEQLDELVAARVEVGDRLDDAVGRPGAFVEVVVQLQRVA